MLFGPMQVLFSPLLKAQLALQGRQKTLWKQEIAVKQILRGKG